MGTAEQVQNARSLCAVFQQTVLDRPDELALSSSDGQVRLTWREYEQRVRRIAAGLATRGVRHGDTVALMLTNRPEFHLVDVAVMHLGATPFSIYNTSSPEQIVHRFATAGNRVVVCEEPFLDRVRAAAEQAGVDRIVCVGGPADGVISLAELEASGDPDFDFDSAWRAVGPDDLLTLIFTSGTTGPPKGVEISHGNVLYTLGCLHRFPEALGGSDGGGCVLSFLPDAHMANRLFAHYLPIAVGATVVTLRDARTAMTVAQQVHPTMFVSVPAIWYKLKAAAEQLLAADEATWAVQAGLAKVRHELSGAPVPEEVRARYAEADTQVLAPLRAKLGFDRLGAGICGGAPIAADALEFIMALGIRVLEGWAMSETAGAGILNPPDGIRPGTLGRPVAGTEIKVAEDGELLVRSRGIMKGYRNEPEKTAEAVDGDGWLHTGDVVTVSDDGYVTIIDRKKELIINSAGKNMSPANIENAVLTSCSLIGSAVAIGDRRPYVTALLTLNPEMAVAFAADHGFDDASPEALSRDPQVRADVQKGVEQANATLSRVEQIKAFTILPTYWLPDSDELTPTMKVKRRVINEKYVAEIDELYSRPRPSTPAKP